ncbi:ribbon-helix-helix protein, CopG family [bacterium]|jgi:predicted transcriptional regulator|nr:ribbon-helix-helix protein, CopG family [bacterium]
MWGKLMTLTVRLDDQEEYKLQQIVEALNAESQSALIRDWIEEKWSALQSDRTFVERRGGHPKHLLAGSAGGSERANRKSRLAERFEQKAQAREPSISEE